MAEGLSLAERVILDAALGNVPGAGAGGPRISRLVGGARNRTWHVQTRAGQYVVRIHPDDGLHLGIHRAREIALHRAAASSGLAPLLVHADPEGKFLISEYVAGQLWTPADFEDPDRLRNLAAALGELHAIRPPDVPPFDLLALLERHCERLAAADSAEAPALSAVYGEAARALAASGAGRRPLTIVHNDLHHSNIITAGRLRLIDWEYAGVADPLFDLACIVAYYPSAEPHSSAMLEASGLAGSASAAMLAEAAKVFRLVSALWERARALPA